MGTRNQHQGNGFSDRQLARADQDAEILRLKRTGLTYVQIGERLGISIASVHRGFYRALPTIAEPEATEFRNEHLKRLDLQREVVMDILTKKHVVIQNGHAVSEVIYDENGKATGYGENYEDDSVVMAAVEQLRKIDESERKLLGLDARAQVEVAAAVRYEVVGLGPDDLK